LKRRGGVRCSGGRSVAHGCKPDRRGPHAPAVGQPDAMATLIRRMLTRTKAMAD
jgi:hypothetical protein